jgi:hypothetical protein
MSSAMEIMDNFVNLLGEDEDNNNKNGDNNIFDVDSDSDCSLEIIDDPRMTGAALKNGERVMDKLERRKRKIIDDDNDDDDDDNSDHDSDTHNEDGGQKNGKEKSKVGGKGHGQVEKQSMTSSGMR